MPLSTVPDPHRRTRCALVVGGGLLLVLLGLGLALLYRAHLSASSTTVPVQPTVDPRLIIRPRHAPIAAVLSHGVRLAGTLYPAYPGRNTLLLAVQGHAGAPTLGKRVALVARMPGMAMAPIQATLVAHDHHYVHYVGTLTLPMFGAYRVQVVVDTPVGRATGTLTLTLSLPHL
jgi:hypothetical protein